MAKAPGRASRWMVWAGLFGLSIWAAHASRPVVAKDPPKGDEPIRSSLPAGTPGAEQVRQINKWIAKGWKDNKLKPSVPCTDYEFIRRASLDIIGRIAKPEELRQYMNDSPSTRRRLLIDRLLNSEEYARNWAGIWTVWLMTRSAPAEYRNEISLWLEEQFSQTNRGWDKIVGELLTATGKNTENGAVNFVLQHLGEPTPADKVGEEGQFSMVPITSRTTRLFLGLQTQCTQCHDHPFNPQWKQQHFWGVNGFFRQIERKGAPVNGQMMAAPQQTLVDNASYNQDNIIFFERRNGVVLPTRPQFLDGQKLDAHASKPRRQQLAELILASEYFPKAYVNRTWAHFFGHGMNNPGAPDDFGEHNPPTHPELLDYLAKEIKTYQYNPRELIRWICNSEAYGLSTVANGTNDKADAEPFFSRMLLKAMSPEQLFESLMTATQAEAAETKDAKKRLRETWMRSLIVNFGDDEGNEVTFNGTVVQALLMMNGKEINESIAHKEKGPVAAALRRKGASPKTIMDDLFVAVLNRPASAREQEAIGREIRAVRAGYLDHQGSKVPVRSRDPWALWQDVVWGLLNSNEFILNH